MGTITKLGLRKVILGIQFMGQLGVLATLIIVLVPAEFVAACLSALGVFAGAKSIGLGTIVYGNVKEHEAKNGGS